MAQYIDSTIIFQHDNNIQSADITAIFTFIQTTLGSGYVIKVMEVSNAGHIILKYV